MLLGSMQESILVVHWRNVDSNAKLRACCASLLNAELVLSGKGPSSYLRLAAAAGLRLLLQRHGASSLLRRRLLGRRPEVAHRVRPGERVQGRHGGTVTG